MDGDWFNIQGVIFSSLQNFDNTLVPLTLKNRVEFPKSSLFVILFARIYQCKVDQNIGFLSE